MNIKDTYNKIAEDWHRTHQNDDWWVSGTEHFCALLPKGSLVLDVGCGGGVKSKYFVEKGMTVVGADISENMVSIAKREVPQARFVVFDVREVDTLPETFDGIFAQAVLLHLPKKEIVSILKKFKEKLKEGGYLYVAVKEQRADKSEEEIEDPRGRAPRYCLSSLLSHESATSHAVFTYISSSLGRCVREYSSTRSSLAEIKDMDDYGYPYELFFSYFTQGEMEQYFSEAGFEVVSSTVIPSGRTRWIQIVGRNK